jgi:peptidoglycan/LPS O-acetylase OafA/YrhL
LLATSRGEISYSIYMTHEVVNHALLPSLQGFKPTAVFAITTATSLFLSTLLYYLVEAPSRNFVKGIIRTRRPVVLADAGLTVGAAKRNS